MQQRAESLVFSVRQIDCDARLVIERQEEAMREAFVMLLRTDIGAPFQTLDSIDFRRQRQEGRLHRLDLLCGRGVLELEKNDVAIWPVGGIEG